MSASEQGLAVSLLSKDFYSAHKGVIPPSLRTGLLGEIVSTIDGAHEKYGRDLSIDEIGALYPVFHPTSTPKQREAANALFDVLKDVKPLGLDAASDVIKDIWKRQTAKQVAEMALDVWEGRSSSFQKISELIEGSTEDYVPDIGKNVVTTDLDQLLAMVDTNGEFKFNLPSLAAIVPGAGPGNLAIFFARPEMGKTAFWVSLAAGPGGFAEQGYKVHALCNEEPAHRTMMRCVQAYTGLTFDEIKADPRAARLAWEAIRQNITLIDEVGASIEHLDEYARLHKPDILIVDQIDKLRIEGEFARDDQRLGHIYVGAREIAKRRKCFFIALTQASADAENKRYLQYAMMAESKTSKAAEADLIIGIGRPPSQDGQMADTPSRTLSISKNKINGMHPAVHCILNQQLSRYEV